MAHISQKTALSVEQVFQPPEGLVESDGSIARLHHQVALDKGSGGKGHRRG